MAKKRTNGGKYTLVRDPEHPRATTAGYVPEHRLVMEQKLGRHLEPGEVVHHHDGDRKNNHPDNLMLFSSSGVHIRYHRLETKRLVRQELTAVTPKEWGELWLASVGLYFVQCEEMLLNRGYSGEVVRRMSEILGRGYYQLIMKRPSPDIVGGFRGVLDIEARRYNHEITKEQFITFAMLKAREF